YDKKPEPGDLIEIFRGTYQHWAIYVGEGYVIHLAPPSEHAQAGAYSMIINNLLDEKYEPRPIRDVLRDAHSLLGKELTYNVFTMNCEHFVTELRYGKPESRQVRQAVAIGGAAVAGIGIVGVVLAVASAFHSSEDNEEQKH
ncbi:HRAS-like suppressor 3, partial [Anabarilius grahami]